MEEIKALIEEYIHFIEEAVPLWEKWFNSLPEQGDFGKIPQRIFSEYSGLPENGHVALMFSAFCGGLERGLYGKDDSDEEKETQGYIITVTANDPQHTATIFVPDSEHVRVKAYMEKYGLSIVHAERTDISEADIDCPVVDGSTFGYYVDDSVSGGDRKFVPDEGSSEDFESINNVVIDNLIIELMTR